MIECRTLFANLDSGAYDGRLREVYCCGGDELLQARDRVRRAVQGFLTTFSRRDDTPAGIFSGPGRTELGGNHTDHQGGRVLAASVNLDTLCCAAPNGSDVICIHSEGYAPVEVALSCLAPQPAEAGTSAALVRGVAAALTARGFPITGFDGYVVSNVLSGSGLSSSAAYEVMLGVTMNGLFCGGALDGVQIAQIGQYAENVFFGKPCGLMDQMASAVGSAVAIDLADAEHPVITQIPYDFNRSGHALCIIDSGADHADLTDEYAAIPAEMGAIAAYFGKSVLRQVDEDEFRRAVVALRQTCGDRAVLRAHHFYTENRRAARETAALQQGDFGAFLEIAAASGRSSCMYLQNIFCCTRPREQAVAIALAAAEQALEGAGMCRVHGGGFAGTIQAFVPLDRLSSFRTRMETVLGSGCCHVLSIRPVGGAVLFA